MTKKRSAGFTAKAFTLAELTLALLVMSIIIIALAPVITKRVINNIQVTSGTQSEVKAYAYDQCENIPECTKVENPDGTKYCDCEFSAPANAKAVNVIMVSGGGGGAGALQSIPIDATVSTSDSQKKIIIPITKDMQDITIKNLTGAGGGGGGGAWKSESGIPPASQDDCPSESVFLSAAENAGKAACVTQYNIGDMPNLGPWEEYEHSNSSSTTLNIASSINLYYFSDANGDGWVDGTETNCITAQPRTCNDNGGTGYSGCNRTICKVKTAENLCRNLKANYYDYANEKTGEWRLPKTEETYAWGEKILSKELSGANPVADPSYNNLESNKLFLCIYSAGGYQNIDICDWCSAPLPEDTNIKWGATGYPNMIWGSTDPYNVYDDYDYYTLTELRSYVRPATNLDNACYASTRCVMEKTADKTKVYGGGGGGGAPSLNDFIIRNDILSASIGGEIILKGGSGGSGGKAASTSSTSGASGENGEDGEYSSIEIYDSSHKLVWGIKVPGGKGGKGASTTAPGAGGGEKQLNTCEEYNGNNWVPTYCSNIGAKGGEGASNESGFIGELYAAQGGKGGSANNSPGGDGGDYGNCNGHTPSTDTSAGGGGGGGAAFTASEQPKDYLEIGKGGKGANGKVEITYKISSQSAAGGGGGGGAFAKIRDILVTTGSKYTVKIGSGGSGGEIGYDGKNGGDSSVEFGSLSITATGGKGGKIGSTSSTNVIHGSGGAGGAIATNGVKGDSEYRNGKAGGEGKNATNGSGDSWGGLGGESALRIIGGCGGLNLISPCSNSSINGLSINFEAPKDITKTVEYGSAGAGGGGGGWSFDVSKYPTPGTGGNGQDGYVYIYWTKD